MGTFRRDMLSALAIMLRSICQNRTLFGLCRFPIPLLFFFPRKFGRQALLDLPFNSSGIVSRAAIVLLIGLLGMVYQAALRPPPNRTADQMEPSNGELPVVSPRIRLGDGRYLAYRELGVPKEKAKYKIIIIHGFGSSKEMNFLAPQELIDELGIYLLQYDRAGYGESDPNPKLSLKSEVLDIQELADQLQIGPKFYVVGVSMGSYATWSCLKYIPHRLAGVALVAPVINYQWPSLPEKLIKEDYRRKLMRWAMWLARYSPTLLHWWVTQKWLPSTSVIEGNPRFFNNRDIEILKTIPGFPMLTKEKLMEQDVFDALRHDWMVAFGKWEFDPTELSNPFAQNSTLAHIWQVLKTRLCPPKSRDSFQRSYHGYVIMRFQMVAI